MSRRRSTIETAALPRDGYSNEWLTPPGILSALGEFDLDPCASVQRPWDTAGRHYTIEDDGLRQEWEGRVWLNPPYDHPEPWVERLALHGDGIALLFARTDTKWFKRSVWGRAQGLMFLSGRLRFYFPDGSESRKNPGAPSVLIAYGDDNVEVLDEAERTGRIAGHLVRLGSNGLVAIRRQPRLPSLRRARRAA